jgi:hypothetical protein
MAQQPENLQQLLDRIHEAKPEEGKVSLGAIVAAVGDRSFGPLLLLAGLLTVSPLSGIPGMPTSMGVLTLMIASQLLFGRSQFWLPGWLVRRKISQDKIAKALKFLRPPARFIDRGVGPRLQFLVGGMGARCIALVCVILAVSMPPMEVVPFSVNGVGAILMLFGLALIARDGVLALTAFLFTLLLSAVLIRHFAG